MCAYDVEQPHDAGLADRWDPPHLPGKSAEAVVLGFADWERLSRVPSLGRLLMSAPLESGDLPERDRSPLRDAGL